MDNMNNVTIINGLLVKDSEARKEIEKLKSKQKKYIFIGDSYADGYTANGNVESWIIKTAAKLDLTLNLTYFKSHFGGIGFVNSVDNKTFLTLLNDLNISNKEDITDIVVLGGFNDKEYTSEEIINGITNFINTAKGLYPNATIHIGEIGWSPSYTSRKKIQKMLSECYSKINILGGRFIQNIQFALHNYEWLTDDYGHPNADGQESISKHLCDYLLTDICDVELPEIEETFGNGKIYTTIKNERVYFRNLYSYVTFEPMTIDATHKEIMDSPSKYLKGSNIDFCTFRRKCVCALNDGKYEDAMLNFVIKNGKLYVCCFEVNSTGGSYRTIANVKGLQIPSGSDVLNAFEV